MEHEEALKYAWWASQRVAEVLGVVEDEWRKEVKSSKERAEAARLAGKQSAEMLAATMRLRVQPMLPPPQLQLYQPRPPFRQQAPAGPQDRQPRGRGSFEHSKDDEARKRSMWDQLQRAAQEHVAPDGRQLCMDYLRAGYGVGNLELLGLPPVMCKGDSESGCSLGHARLPNGVITWSGRPRTWKPPSNDLPDQVAMQGK